jgi:predicted PurR-regulated permease PerM
VVERHFLFWLAVLVLVVLALWLLSEILLPFVAGLAIAYLLTPLTDRLERFGINRLAAALLIIAVVVLALVYLILLVAPIVGAQLSSFIDSVPANVTRLQALLSDPSRSWLQKLLGAGFSADKSIGDLVTQGVGWLTTFLRSLWSGGRALVSLFSLVVVTPVVAFYLIYDWHRMIRNVDSWIPIQYRDTVRELARGGRCDRRLRARADRGVPYTRLLLRGCTHSHWTQFRSAHRPHLRSHHIYPVCRIHDGSCAGAWRGGRAVLAGLRMDPYRARHFPCRSICRR